MITLKNGQTYKYAHIDNKGVILSNGFTRKTLSAKQYSEQWAKGVISPLPEPREEQEEE